MAGDSSVGVGAAWADYDNDGYLDLFVANFGGGQFLYHNNGDGTFTNVVASSGITNSDKVEGQLGRTSTSTADLT